VSACRIDNAVDATVPVPGNSCSINTESVTNSSLTHNWTAAEDETDVQADLQYLVFYSASNNIYTVENCESNGTAFGASSANISDKNTTGLTASTTYYFNVIVKDEAENKELYSTLTLATNQTGILISGYYLGAGDGTYAYAGMENGKVIYTYNDGIYDYMIYWNSINSRLEIYTSQYSDYDYYHPTSTGFNPPNDGGWLYYNSTSEPSLSLNPQ